MRKYFIVIAIFLLFISQITGISFSDVCIKLDLKKWNLVKTESENLLNDIHQNYVLKISKNPYKLTLQVEKGNILWTKTNLRSRMDWSWFECDNNNKTIVDYNKLPEDLKTGSLDTNNIVDRMGNCMLMDITYNRYVFVDKSGTEVSLPQNSASLDYLGLFYGKYLVFCQMDSLDYFSFDKDSDSKPIYPKFNLKNNFSDVKNWCVIFNINGSIFKQFKLPDDGIVMTNEIYFDDSMNLLAYEWWNPQTDAKGCVLMTTNGEVLKVENHDDSSSIYVYYPVFSDDCSLWVPMTQGGDDIEILDTKTGNRVFILEDILGSHVAISNREVGYMIFTTGHGVHVFDYKNITEVLYQYNENAVFSDPWISGDGKDIRFTYQEKDKPAEVRFYRLQY